MPSDHAQFMSLLCTFVVLNLLDKSCRIVHRVRLIISFLMISLTIAVGYSRVYLLMHTEQQVIVGFIVGSVLGYMYFKLYRHLSLSGLFDRWQLEVDAWYCHVCEHVKLLIIVRE